MLFLTYITQKNRHKNFIFVKSRKFKREEKYFLIKFPLSDPGSVREGNK